MAIMFWRRADVQTEAGDPAPGAETPRAGSGPRAAKATRRALLALGGWLAGGRVVRAALDEHSQEAATAQARLKLAEAALGALRAHTGRGQFNVGERDPIAVWSRRRLDAKLELSRSKEERVAAARQHLDEMKGVEQIVNRMHAAGEIDRLSQMDAEYRRLEAEHWLEQEQAGMVRPPSLR